MIYTSSGNRLCRTGRPSGLSGAAYCKKGSLVYHRFVYWRQKLTGSEEPSKAAQARSGFARVAPMPERV
ncbi:IS66 family insertion sequence element accessory protein TnpA [Marinobacter salarius]|uniref:IS66 family insertion sequence element accessory protein TnpA n=1 Tax=Marinobacter salarius TaxID=1420917 RepID=UPI003BAC17A1